MSQPPDALGWGALIAYPIIGAAYAWAVRHIIRRPPAQAQGVVVAPGAPHAPPPAPSSVAAIIEEIEMSWLSKYVFDPIENFVTGKAKANDPAVLAAQAAFDHAKQADLALVNPALDVAVEGIEALLDTFVKTLGPLAIPAEIAEQTILNPSLALGATVLKAAIDKKLGITPATPAAVAAPNPGGAS